MLPGANFVSTGSQASNMDRKKDKESVLDQAISGVRKFIVFGLAQRPVRLALCLLGLAVLSLSSLGALAQSAPAATTVEGKARIVDGDTLEIGGRLVHLYGVDAPEPDQRCERDGRRWRCGMEATFAMAALLETHWLICRQRGIDTTGNMVAECRVGGQKGMGINQEIVRRGWALALRPAGDDYAAAEQDAKTAKVGLWSGTFVAPWEWRRTQETGKTAN